MSGFSNHFLQQTGYLDRERAGQDQNQLTLNIKWTEHISTEYFTQTPKEYTSAEWTNGSFYTINCMHGQKANLNKFGKFEIALCILFEHSATRLKINSKQIMTTNT